MKQKSAEQIKSIPDFVLIDNLAYLMDDLFRIPGTKLRFGLDPILGLVPGAGDAISALISIIMLITLLKYKISQKVLIMMAGNIFLDFILGSIPVIGDLVDFTFKPNQRNQRLLREHLEEGRHQGSGRGLIIGFLIIMTSILVLIIILICQLISYLISLIHQG